MSSEQYQRTVNSLDKEIADLEKKKAAKDREVANLQGKINTLKKSITAILLHLHLTVKCGRLLLTNLTSKKSR